MVIKKNCLECGKEFLSYPSLSTHTCSRRCGSLYRMKTIGHPRGMKGKIGYWKNKKRDEKTREKLKVMRLGKIPWNKGLSIKSNNALEIWRKNGGKPWNKYEKPYKSHNKKRREMMERDNYTCLYCKSCFNKEDNFTKVGLTTHHIIPLRVSNDKNSNNIISLCRKCHPILEKLRRKNLVEYEQLMISIFPSSRATFFNYKRKLEEV